MTARLRSSSVIDAGSEGLSRPTPTSLAQKMASSSHESPPTMLPAALEEANERPAGASARALHRVARQKRHRLTEARDPGMKPQVTSALAPHGQEGLSLYDRSEF